MFGFFINYGDLKLIPPEARNSSFNRDNKLIFPVNVVIFHNYPLLDLFILVTFLRLLDSI